MRRKSSLAAQISSCQPVSQGPSDWFCSSDTCHPVSSLSEVCFLFPLSPYKDWGLGLTDYCYIPTYLFLSRSLFLHTNVGEINNFLSRNRIPFVAWGVGGKPWTRKWYLCWHGEFPAPEVWGTTLLTVKVKKSRNVTITLHNRLNVIVVKIFRGALKKLLLSFCTLCVCHTVRQQLMFLALCSHILPDQL